MYGEEVYVKEGVYTPNYNVLKDKIFVGNDFPRDLTDEEAEAVLLHEAWHKSRGTFYRLGSLSLLFVNAIIAFKFVLTWYHIFLIILADLSILIPFARREEYLADEHSIKKGGSTDGLMTALKKLGEEDRPVWYKLYGKITHPTDEDRKKNLEQKNF